MPDAKKSATTGLQRGDRLRVPVERSIEHCRVFADGDMLAGDYTVRHAIQVAKERGGYVWLGLREPQKAHMENVAEAFGIHELIVDDAVTAHQRPKVERYDDQLFIVIRSVTFTDDEQVDDTHEVIQTLGEVQMLLGPNFIITVRHSAPLPGAHELDHHRELASTSPAALAYLLADRLVAHYVRISLLLEDEVDELETTVFTPGTNFNIDKIYLYKREVLEMRHATDPLAPALQALIRDHKDIIPKQIRSYFRDVLDAELQVKDRISGFDARLSTLIDASVAKVTMQQNKDMRTISAVVSLAAVPTLIAGIYGMNFDNMPELSWEYGYYGALVVMVVIMAALVWWFRRTDWL